jgi:aspartate/glutamate racemase
MDPDEPAEVRANRAFLSERGVWHQVSRNWGNPDRKGEPVPATGCADAAYKRHRLGNVGIPLFDELKSHVGVYDDGRGRHYVAAHCRGTQVRDDEKLAAAVGHAVTRLSAEELGQELGMARGLVNPMSLARSGQVHQIFDQSVLWRIAPPYTMMTNIGEATYGVEFYPEELINGLEDAIVGDIVADEFRHQPTFHTIGILTGNGPESGIELWGRLNEKIQARRGARFRGDVSFPKVIVESVPDMGVSMELRARSDRVERTVLDGVGRLCEDGATLIAVACNTTQFFAQAIEDVCERHGASFVSLVEATGEALTESEVEAFDLLGIGAVTDLDEWSDFLRLTESFDVRVPNDVDVRAIDDLGFWIKRLPEPRGRDVNRLADLIAKRTQTETVVIALTELSLVFEEHKKTITSRAPDKRFVDTLDELAAKLAELYCADWERAEQRPEIDD